MSTPCEQKDNIAKIYDKIADVEKAHAETDGKFKQYLIQMSEFFTNYREDIKGIRDDINGLSTTITKILTKSDFIINKDENGVNVTVESKKSFWDTEAGKVLPKWIAISVIGVVLVVTISLVGTNWIEFFKQNSEILKTLK